MTKKKKEFVDKETGSVYVKAVQEEVALATKGMGAKVSELSDASERQDAEIAWLKERLAETDALANAAARASAIPIPKKKAWEPLPLERYPEGWVESYGTTHVAVKEDFTELGIQIGGTFIPLRAGHVIETTKNVAEVMAEIGIA